MDTYVRTYSQLKKQNVANPVQALSSLFPMNLPPPSSWVITKLF